MTNIAVMYHYVREKNGWKGIFPLLPEEFESQIDFLCTQYEIISVDDLQKTEAKQKPLCVLTFDDGTKDQYEIAFNLLKKKGIPAFFAIMSGPLQERKVPVVHLVHTVLSFYSDEEVWEKIEKTHDISIEQIHNPSAIYTYEKDLYRRYNKYALNVLFSEAQARLVLVDLFDKIFPDKNQFINNFYINKDELLEMHKAGMSLGVHCHDHLIYRGDARLFYQQEIAPCKKYLEDELNIIPSWYTPAFGAGPKVQEMKNDLTPILIENGFKGGFTTIPEYMNTGSFWMDRFDCNQFPPKRVIEVKKALTSD